MIKFARVACNLFYKGDRVLLEKFSNENKVTFDEKIVEDIAQTIGFNSKGYEKNRKTFWGVYFGRENLTDEKMEEIERFLRVKSILPLCYLLYQSYHKNNETLLFCVFFAKLSVKVKEAEKLENFFPGFEKKLEEIKGNKDESLNGEETEKSTIKIYL